MILLAAGGSTRMGRTKQALPYRGATLLRHAVGIARGAGLGPIVVVLGAEADSLRDGLVGPDLRVVVNTDWAHGMGGSIAVGMAELDREAPAATAVLVILADQPRVGPGRLRALAAELGRDGARIAACRYDDGALGVPAIFDRSFFPELRALAPAAGARSLIRLSSGEVRSIELGEDALDVDTLADYQHLLATEPNPGP